MPDLDEMRDDLALSATLDEMRERWPLAAGPMSVPWSREPTPDPDDPEWHRFTSQRRALEACFQAPPHRDARILCVCLFGGNGSGKTVAARLAAVLVLLGRAHPAVQMLIRSTGLDLPWLRSEPGRVLFVAKSSNDSIRYHRKDVRGLLPVAGQHRWYNLNAKGEAHVIVDGDADSPDGAVVKLPGKGEAWFKSADQGWEAFQGDKWDCVQIDEELLQPDGERTFDELLQRVARVGGRILYSMTALSGPSTWTMRRFDSPDGRPEYARVVRLDALDNPHVDRQSLRIVYRGMSEAQRKQRQRGEAVALEGRILPALDCVNVGAWDGPHNLIPASFVPPAGWTLVLGVDYGFAKPSAVVWSWKDPDGRLYDCRLLYVCGLSAPELAHLVAWVCGAPGVSRPPRVPTKTGGGTRHRAITGMDVSAPVLDADGEEVGWGEPVEIAVVDAAYPAVIRALLEQGIQAVKGRKDRARVIDALRAASAVQEDGRPRWYIREDLLPLIEECDRLVHKTSPGGDPHEKQVVGEDHAFDAKCYQAEFAKRQWG